VSGLAAPEEMLAFIQDGCAPAIAWWSFVDLGYLTYYVNYLLADGQLNGDIGESFIAGRLGEYTIEADPNRDGGKMVLLGDFTIYTIDNAE
jgi:rhamnose transport system substrate-binding protein